MAYLLPGVRVEQILRRPNAILVDVDLYATIVGPVYRVIRNRKMRNQGTLPIYRFLANWDVFVNGATFPGVNIVRPRAGDFYTITNSDSVAPAAAFDVNVGTVLVPVNVNVKAGDSVMFDGTSWIKKVTMGPVYTFGFPVLDPGAKVDANSTEIWLKDAWAEWVMTTTGANLKVVNNVYQSGFLAGQEFFVDKTRNFLQDGVLRGDRLWVGDVKGGNGYYTVDKVEEHTLYFRSGVYKTIPDDAGDPTKLVGYSILRFYTEFKLDKLDYLTYVTTNTVEVDIFAHVTYDQNENPVSHPFYSGQVEVSYRALRADFIGLKRYVSSEEVEADMENDVWNPLGFALCRGTFAANGNTRPALAYCLAEDNDSAYIDSLAELATYKKTYILVPLTQSSQVANAFAAHVIHMSAQPISYFRITLVSRKLTTQKTLLPTTIGTATNLV